MIIDEPRQDQCPALRALWREAFGDTEDFLDTFARTAYSPRRCRCVTLGEEVIGALYWFDCLYEGHPIAYLYAIATARAHRGHGVCRSLLEDTHRHLSRQGYEGAILVPGSNELFSLYERLGYRVCGHIREFRCAPSVGSMELRPVSAEEYALLRRRFLPADGVLQEGENLRFLQTMAELYAGKDCLLAARGEGDTLYGLELLGKEADAPHVVHALGYAKGFSRAPGKDRPFVMYHPLSDSSLPPPAYFGLAFD